LTGKDWANMGRKRKHTDGRYDRGKPQKDTLVGDLDGISGIVKTVRHDNGRWYVTVQWFCNPRLGGVDKNCPVCHGKPVEHRWDNLTGKHPRIKSCGRLKAKHYRDHLEKKTKHPDIDVTGKPIPATARKKGKQ
jgi:hypothetical protein